MADDRKRKHVGGSRDKAKRKYFQGSGGESLLATGTRGLLITCDVHQERKAIRECLALLDSLSGGDEVADAGGAEEASGTAGDALARDLAALREQEKGSAKRFAVAQTGIAGVIMIRIADAAVDPVQLADRVMEEAIASQRSCAPHVVRILPVQTTCSAHVGNITQAAAALLGALRGSEDTYAVQWRRRCNTGIDKMEVINAVAAAVSAVAPKARVDLAAPAAAVMVDVMKTVCCVSVLPDWRRVQSYNLRAACEASSSESRKVTVVEKAAAPAAS